MPNQKDIAAESGAPMIPEQRRELMLRQLRKHQVLSVCFTTAAQPDAVSQSRKLDSCYRAERRFRQLLQGMRFCARRSGKF